MDADLANAAQTLAASLGLQPLAPAEPRGLAAGEAEHGLVAPAADLAAGLAALFDPDLATDPLLPPAPVAAAFGLCRVRSDAGGWALEVVHRGGAGLDVAGAPGSFALHADDDATALVRPAPGAVVVVAAAGVGLAIGHDGGGGLVLTPLQRTAPALAGAAAAMLLADAVAYRHGEGDDLSVGLPLGHAHPDDVAAARALCSDEIGAEPADLDRKSVV